MGADLCRTLQLVAHKIDAERLLGETSEMAALQHRKDAFPLTPFPDLRPMLNRLDKGGTVETGEFHQISLVLGQIADIKAKLRSVRASFPLLGWKADTLSDHARMKSTIDRCIDDAGNIRSTATPDLKDLMNVLHGCKEWVRKRMETMLSQPGITERLQEQYFDLRENRYVLPVRAECRSHVPGIVHDVSASGATVFIEPRELVEHNNRIKVAELEVEREVQGILNDLARQLMPHTASIRSDLQCLAELDCIAAKAAMGHLLDASAVEVNTQGRIRLNGARHPLLILARLRARRSADSAVDHAPAEVIANDLHLCEDVRGLVISGPNAGGKTVTLKLLGLFALMVRAGLHLPCAGDSEMALFPEVYADIGDAQDLSRDLSSFSAHITQMIALLRHADPGGLVLLDEPVTATDPTEGAALAEALLLRLAAQGLKVVVTTHYSRLKVLAQSRFEFLNASAEFDVQTLSPTYRVLFGVPGGSSALDIAGRLGMDEALLDTASSLVKQGSSGADEQAMARIVHDLQRQRRRLEEELACAQAAREEGERLAQVQQEATARMQQAERTVKRDARRKIGEEFAVAKRKIYQLLEEVKKERSPASVKKAREYLAAVEREATGHCADPVSRVPIDQIRVGDHVDIIPLGVVGMVMACPSRGRVRVRIGERELSVDINHLGGKERATSVEQPTKARAIAHATSPRPAVMETGADVLDVRGKCADDALDAVAAFLDQASLTSAPLVRVIHGHGTGTLKQVLRDYLKTSRYVTTFHPADRNEGGDGVTIIVLGT